MAIEIERLIATLEAKMDKFEKALAKQAGGADRQFKRIEDRGKKMERTLAGLGVAGFRGLAAGAVGALAPILSLTGAIQGTKAALAEFDDIAKNAKASGLDVEFFQGLAYQAQLGGVAFDQLSGAVATFARNSGLAVVGKGKMVAALKELHPQLLENIRAARSQEERIRLVADALSKEADASRRAAIATALFGEAGAKLVGVFEGGAAEIDRMQANARKLGIVVDRDLIARAEELGDELDTVTKIVDLQLKQALINLGPILVWLAGLAGGIAEAVRLASDGFNAIEARQSSTLEARLAGIDRQIAIGNDPFQSPNLGQATPFDAAALEAEREAILAEMRKRAIANLTTQLTARPPSTGDIPTLDEVESRNKAAQAAIKQADAVKKLVTDLEMERQALFMTAEQQAAFNIVGRAGIDVYSEQGQKLYELALANEQLKNAMQAVDDIARTAIGTFVDNLRQGKSAADALTNALGNIANKLLDMALDNAISGFVRSLFGGGFAPFGGSAITPRTGLLPSFAGGGSTGGGARSGGIDGMGGFLAMLHPQESVIDHARGQGGAHSIVINIDAKGAEIGVEQKIALAIKQVVPQMIREQAPGAVAVSQRNRGLG